MLFADFYEWKTWSVSFSDQQEGFMFHKVRN